MKLKYVIGALILLLYAAIAYNTAHADSLQFCSPTPATSTQTSAGYTTTITGGAAGACAVAAIASCVAPTIASSTTGIAHFSRFGGPQKVYTDSGLGPSETVDVWSFDAMFGAWPGRYGFIAYVMLPTNGYLAMQFKVPAGFMPATQLFGAYESGETGNKANYSITISACPGDFSNPSKTGSTVVRGCWKNKLATKGLLQWTSAGTSCVLQNATTYYLNFINADISLVQPNGAGTAASTRTVNCTNGVCELPIYNGPGNWSGYKP